MDLDRAIADLPPDTQSYIRTSLTDHHIKVDDPIVAIMLFIAQMSRPRLPVFATVVVSALFIVVSVSAWCFGLASGRSSALTEAYQPRPMVMFTTPGSSVVYGTQAGRQVFTISCPPKAVETWVSKGTGIVTVK